MKSFLLIALFLFPAIVICQNKELTISIDSMVEKIDRFCKGKTKSYTLIKLKNNKEINEKWQYADSKQFTFINIEYKIDSTVYSEKYYLKKGSLLYAYESELRYFPSLKIDDHSTWAGDFYFANNKLINHVTLGHGKSESDDWDPEKEILQRLRKRKVEINSLK